MTTENDFLPFAGGPSANVISQATYAALAAQTAGFSAGVAPSAQLNKVWRQSSIIAAVIAQFIVQEINQPVIDDGTTSTILANLVLALQALVGGVNNSETTVNTTGGNTVLTAAQYVCRFIVVTGTLSSNATLTFPAAYGTWTVINQTTGSFTLTCTTASGTGIVVAQGMEDTIIGDSTNIKFNSGEAVTQASSNNSNAIATTAFVQAIVNAAGSGFPWWCGTSTGSANAQVLSTPVDMLQFAAGMSVAFQAGFTNTGATTLTVGSFGTYNVLKDGPSGPVALTGGEIIATNLISVRRIGPNVHLTATELGTSALANASSGTGTVAAVTGSGSIVPGHIAVFSDINGTVQDGGPAGVANATYLNASNNGNTLAPGFFNVDTNYSGAFQVLLPSTPLLGQTLDFTDIAGAWGTNNFTLNNNGNTIMGILAPMVCNTSGESFKLWWNGSDWRIA